jgi:6-phosphogluconate dehydrogenase
MSNKKTDIGLIGLAVMGENLALTWKVKIGRFQFITVLFRVWKKVWLIVL